MRKIPAVLAIVLAAASAQTKPNSGLDFPNYGATDLNAQPNTNLYANQFPSVQAAINALPSGGGTVYVPTGTFMVGPITLANNVHLIFGAGLFTNTSTSGGNFITIPSGVAGASVSGQGAAVTTLQSNSSGSQFNAIVWDSGTDSTISDATLDGNDNTTDVILAQQSTRGRYHSLRLLQATSVAIASITGNGATATVTLEANSYPPNGIGSGKLFRIAGNSNSGFNVGGPTTVTITAGTTRFTFASTATGTGRGGYFTPAFLNSGISIDGGSGHEISNVECVGGPNDCFALNTEEFGENFGSLTGGNYSNIYVHDSPSNGFSMNALGYVARGKTISGVTVSGLRSINNGWVGTSGGGDDMSGIALVSNLAHSDGTGISNCSLTGVVALGNGGAGLRLKGNDSGCSFSGSLSGNGLRQTLAYSQRIDAVVLMGGSDYSPTFNKFDVSGDKGRGTCFINETSEAVNNAEKPEN